MKLSASFYMDFSKIVGGTRPLSSVPRVTAPQHHWPYRWSNIAQIHLIFDANFSRLWFTFVSCFWAKS